MKNISREAFSSLVFSGCSFRIVFGPLSSTKSEDLWSLCIPKQLSQHQDDVWSMQTIKSPILSLKPRHLSFMVQLFSADAVLWRYTSVQPGWGPSTIARFTIVCLCLLKFHKSEPLEVRKAGAFLMTALIIFICTSLNRSHDGFHYLIKSRNSIGLNI